MKPVEFFQHWNQQTPSCPIPNCLADEIQAQKVIQQVARDKISDQN